MTFSFEEKGDDWMEFEEDLRNDIDEEEFEDDGFYESNNMDF